MKKFFAMLAVCGLLVGCGDTKTAGKKEEKTTTTTKPDGTETKKTETVEKKTEIETDKGAAPAPSAPAEKK